MAIVHAFDTNFANSTSTVQSGSFAAPANSMLVALCTAGGANNPTLSTTAGSLTWTQRVAWNASTNARGRIYTAPAAAAGNYNVTATNASGGAVSLMIIGFTGVDMASPAGASLTGSSSTINLTVNGYTSTVAGSRGIALAIDRQANPPATSTDPFDSWRVLFEHGAIGVYKSANTATSGANVTFNFDGGSAQRAWNWGSLELIPASEEPATPFFSGWGVPIK